MNYFTCWCWLWFRCWFDYYRWWCWLWCRCWFDYYGRWCGLWCWLWPILWFRWRNIGFFWFNINDVFDFVFVRIGESNDISVDWAVEVEDVHVIVIGIVIKVKPNDLALIIQIVASDFVILRVGDAVTDCVWIQSCSIRAADSAFCL